MQKIFQVIIFITGVREHAMGAAMNGLALYGGLIPFGGTFLIFSDYLKPSFKAIGYYEFKSNIYFFTCGLLV